MFDSYVYICMTDLYEYFCVCFFLNSVSWSCINIIFLYYVNKHFNDFYEYS